MPFRVSPIQAAVWLAAAVAASPAAPAPPTQQSRPAPLDTLSAIPDRPRLYDGDTSDLLPRYAQQLLHGSQLGVRFAIQQLGRAGEAAVPQILRVLEPLEKEEQQFGAIVNCCHALALTKTRDPRALASLRRLIDHKSGSASTEAIRTLGLLGDGSSLATLRGAFASASIEKGRVILRAIGGLEGSEADAALYEIAANEGLPVGYRMDALDALAGRPVATSAPYLRKLLDAPTPAGEKATIALVAARDPAALVKARLLLTQRNNPALRGLAGIASAALAGQGEIDPAILALGDPDPEVQLSFGLLGLKNAIESGALAEGARARVVAALREAERYPEARGPGGAGSANLTRLEAMRLLVKLGEHPTIDRDLEDLASDDPRRVFDALLVVSDRDVADRRATPILLEKLDKAPAAQKRGFMQALGRLRDPAAARGIANYLLGPSQFQDGNWLYEYAALQLANLGEAGAAALLDALGKTKDPERRRAIVEGLAHSTEAKAKESLRAVAADTSEDPETRAAAIRILPDIDRDAAARFLKQCLASEPNPKIRRLLNYILFDRY
jgi:HEAT repeat protein